FIDDSSLTAITTTGRLNLTRAQGQPFSMAVRICSNCHATFRVFFSPAFDTTVKLGLLVSTQVSAAAARGALAAITIAIAHTIRRHMDIAGLPGSACPDKGRRDAPVSFPAHHSMRRNCRLISTA